MLTRTLGRIVLGALLVGIVIPSPPVALAVTTSASPSPVNSWALNDPAGSSQAADSVAGNNGVCAAGGSLSTPYDRAADCPTFGVSGPAASFDGTDDLLRVDNTIANTFTVAAWIKTLPGENGGGWGAAYSGKGIIWSDIGGPANDMIPMALVGAQLAFGTGEGGGCGCYNTIMSVTPVNTGSWVLVAVTRDASTGEKQIYINGVLEATSVGSTGPLSANPYIAFGANPLDYRYFAGALADVQFYDSVLSAGDVKSLLQAPHPSAHRPLIFVPGIGGSELAATTGGNPALTGSHGQSVNVSYNGGDIVWLNGAWMNPVANENFDVLRFDSSGNPMVGDFAPAHRDSPELGSVVQIAGQAYSGVEDFFRSQGYTPGQDFFFATYDWRYSAEHAVPDLGNAVSVALQRNPGADGVDIIAHSMGTLVTRSFLENSPLATEAKHVVLLASPAMGTPMGTVAAVYGVGLPAFPPLGMQPGVERYIFQTLPGGLDQSVQESYYSLYHGQDAQHPMPYVDLRGTRHFYTYPELAQMEQDSGVTSAALTTAHDFHGDDLTWGSQLAGDNIALFSGTGKCTIGQIQMRYAGGRGGLSSYLDYAEINGDGTVVEGVSSMNDGRLVPFPVYYRDASHDQMGASTSILSDALAVVQDRAVSKGSPTQPGFFSFCHAISVHSPMDILITDAQGRRLGGFVPGSDSVDIPGSSFDRIADMKVATVAAAGPYTVSLVGTATGEGSIKVRDWGDGTANSEVLFAHIPTTAKMTGSFTIDASGTPGPLTVDVNGDGSKMVTFSPVVLTGVAANDTTAPSLTIQSPAAGQALVGTAPISWAASDTESGMSFSRAVIDGGTPGEQVLGAPGPLTLVPGVHSLTVIAEDRAENADQATAGLNVYSYRWLPPLSVDTAAKVGQTIPVKFEVDDLNGRPVDDPSVTVSLLDSQGSVVVGPIARGADPATTVVFQGGQYHTDLRTGGLPRGSYRVRVAFSSPALVGQFTIGASLD